MKRGWENLLHGVVAGLVLPAVASVYPQTAAAQDRMGEVQNRMQELQDEVRALQQELQDIRAVDDAQQKQMQDMEAQDTSQLKQLEDRVTTAEAAGPAKRSHKNLVFFRGGYTDYVDDARGFESFTDTHDVDGLGQLLGFPLNEAEGGWYVGAAIEHSLTDDLWGIWPQTEALGEISLEYKNFGSEDAVLVVPSAECSLLTDASHFAALEPDGSCLITGDQAITMFTVSASPKIKFMQGSKLRPWIIPAGLDFHVISPPSDAATYLDVGVQFAAGLEYEIIPGIKFGVDGRYHLVANISDTENNTAAVLRREIAEDPDLGPVLGAGLANFGNTDKDLDFWTIGGYLGFSF
ncbi:MAG: coiled-coil domain-containing protein [Gammaproteobacteria bacterium]